jgi:uncharacterized protein YciI
LLNLSTQIYNSDDSDKQKTRQRLAGHSAEILSAVVLPLLAGKSREIGCIVRFTRVLRRLARKAEGNPCSGERSLYRENHGAPELVGQVAFQYATIDFSTIEQPLRDEHARFLKRHKDVLVTFGPIRHADRTPAGYAYQTDLPGTTAEAIREFLSEDPFAKAGLYGSASVSGWRCALSHRQAMMPSRRELQGFFFYDIAKPNVTERRNTLGDLHRAHLGPRDNTNCLSRGGLTDGSGATWLGSAMVYEFPDRDALDDFFEKEPFRTNGLYERIDIFHWQRGEMAA